MRCLRFLGGGGLGKRWVLGGDAGVTDLGGYVEVTGSESLPMLQ